MPDYPERQTVLGKSQIHLAKCTKIFPRHLCNVWWLWSISKSCFLQAVSRTLSQPALEDISTPRTTLTAEDPLITYSCSFIQCTNMKSPAREEQNGTTELVAVQSPRAKTCNLRHLLPVECHFFHILYCCCTFTMIFSR
jgi:hypothetical protein